MLLHVSYPGAPCCCARFLMTAVITGLFLCGCASGGGGSSSANGGTVLCGTDEMNARPCNGGGPAPAQPEKPVPTVTSTSTERDALPMTAAPVNRDVGSFGAIALQRPIDGDSRAMPYQWIGEGVLRIASDPATQTYTLLFDQAGQVQSEKYDLNDPDFGFRVTTTYKYSDGETRRHEFEHRVIRGLQSGLEPSNPEEQRYSKEVGYLTVLQATRNVSLGQRVTRVMWWNHVNKAWDTSRYSYDQNTLDSDDAGKTHLFFAFGNRTSAADLPVSGRASFRLRGDNDERGYNDITLNGTWLPSLIDDLVLTADFGQQMIAATLDRPPEIRKPEGGAGSADVYYWGVRLHGESSYNHDGFFVIPLAGELITQDPAETQRSIALKGRIDGAFFGPGATEIGGVYAIANDSRSFLVEGSFAGERQ